MCIVWLGVFSLVEEILHNLFQLVHPMRGVIHVDHHIFYDITSYGWSWHTLISIPILCLTRLEHGASIPVPCPKDKPCNIYNLWVNGKGLKKVFRKDQFA